MLAAHVILSMYGFWLPNDPRGSWSDFVAAWELLRYGKATKADTRDSVAYVHHDRAKRMEAKGTLKYPAVLLTGLQARAVARGFARAARESSYPIHACSILDDHVHLVLSSHARTIEQIVRHLRGRASNQLRSEGIHPLALQARPDGSPPSVWSEGMYGLLPRRRSRRMRDSVCGTKPRPRGQARSALVVRDPAPPHPRMSPRKRSPRA